MKKFSLNIKEIAEIAMLVSLAVLLDRDGFKIRLGAQSGSLSLTMVPLIILALRHGFAKAFVGIGIVYGLLTNLLDGYGIVTYPFDYLLAYGSLSLIAFMKPLLDKPAKSPVLPYVYLTGGLLAVGAVRLLFHTISGMLFYDTPFWGSLTYNAVFVVVPALALTIVVMILLWEPLKWIEKRFPVSASANE